MLKKWFTNLFKSKETIELERALDNKISMMLIDSKLALAEAIADAKSFK